MESTALLNDNNADGKIKLGLQHTTGPVARVNLSRGVFSKPVKRDDENRRLGVKTVQRKFAASARACFNAKSFLSLFPVFSWLPRYQWKNDLMADVLAGLTVGVMSIPQGMAYSRMAGIPPVYGLYTNIIPTFVYFFFGTAKHGAMGPATVLSLITSSIIHKHIPCQGCSPGKSNVTLMAEHNGTTTDNSTFVLDMIDEAAVLQPIDIGSALAFLVGVYLLLMGLFRLSFIADYLAEQLVGGFTVAAAVQVFTGQLPSMFGVKLPTRHGIGKVLRNFVDLFSMITQTNIATLATFLICFGFLLTSKKVINPRFQRRLKLPFPGEFIVLVIATVISYYARFSQRFGVSTVRHVPAGFPTPTLPKFSIMESLLADAALLAIVTYSHCISLGKVFAKRNGYRIQTAQEFYAYGFMNAVGSFFQCFNSGQSVARSLVYEMAGAKSQLCGLFGTVVVIVTVLFIAPFLASLPNAVLASVIVTACVEMFLNLRQLPALFRKSKYDFSLFVVTLASVVLLDVTYGLAVSVTYALITVVIRSQRTVVVAIDDEARLLYTSDFTEEIKYADAEEQAIWDRTSVWRLTSSLFYVNAEKVKTEIIERNFGSEDLERPVTRDNSAASELNSKFPPAKTFDKMEIGGPSIVILDMSAVAFIDLMGINAMKEVAKQMNKRGTFLFMCGCTVAVQKLMNSTGFPEDSNTFLFPTLLDGICYARFYYRTGLAPENGVNDALSVKGP